jgi:hypothetical protein
MHVLGAVHSYGAIMAVLYGTTSGAGCSVAVCSPSYAHYLDLGTSSHIEPILGVRGED